MTTPVLEELRKRATAAESTLIEAVVAEVKRELQADKIKAAARGEIIAELRQLTEANMGFHGDRRDPSAALGAAAHQFLKANPKP